VPAPAVEAAAPQVASAPAEAADDDEPRRLQLQFSAPGGTRIIWTLTSPAAPAPSQS